MLLYFSLKQALEVDHLRNILLALFLQKYLTHFFVIAETSALSSHTCL